MSLLPTLRAATLPGATVVLQTAALTPRWPAQLTHQVARLLPGRPAALSGADLDALATAFTSFTDGGDRDAFVHTARGALNGAGQRLESTDQLYLLDGVPGMLIAGSRDRLKVFDRAGHFPHVEGPHRFTALMRQFLAAATPRPRRQEALRRQLKDVSTEHTEHHDSG